jgi:uncharacterized protein (DUF1778 family)
VRSEHRQRQHLVVVRVTAEERSLIWAAADADHMSVSGWVRECALVRAESALSATESDFRQSNDHRTAGGI